MATVPVTDRSLTAYIADFIVETGADDVPEAAAHLGKRSVLDGIGLAFAGAASQTGHMVRRYLDTLSFSEVGGCTVIGGRTRRGWTCRCAGCCRRVRQRRLDPR